MHDDLDINLSVDGMSCASCVARVERALATVPGVVNPAVNLASETATLKLTAGHDLADVVAALGKAGYPARTAAITFDVEGMSCASCVGRVDKTLADVPGVLEVSVNLARGTGDCQFPARPEQSASTCADPVRVGIPGLDAECG